MLKWCPRKRQNKRDNHHLLTLLSAEKVLSVIWDLPGDKQEHTSCWSGKQKASPRALFLAVFLPLLICSVIPLPCLGEQSSCQRLTRAAASGFSLEITGCSNPLQWFQGYWWGKDICIQMKLLYASVATLRFSEEIHGSFSEGEGWAGSLWICRPLPTESLRLQARKLELSSLQWHPGINNSSLYWALRHKSPSLCCSCTSKENNSSRPLTADFMDHLPLKGMWF